MAKTWREKHDGHKQPIDIRALEKPFAGHPVGAKMLIATPKDMTAYFKSVPRGTLRDMDALRRSLAAKHKADFVCPLTTGIFLRIAAEHAYAQILEGAAAETVGPFWRVIDPNSPLAKKLACGPDFIRFMREREGAESSPAPRRAKAQAAKKRPLDAPERSRKSV